MKKKQFPSFIPAQPQNCLGFGAPVYPGCCRDGVDRAGGRPGAAAPRCFSGSSPYLRRVPAAELTLGTLKDKHGGRISAFLPRPRRRRQDRGCRPSQERAVAVLSPRLPQIHRENLGASSECCRACLRKACFLLRSTDRDFFPPVSGSPVADGNFRQGTEPSPPARAAPGPRGWLQPGCGCKYSRLLLPEPISLQGCSARIDESPRCPCSCRRRQDPGALLCLPVPNPTAPNPTARSGSAGEHRLPLPGAPSPMKPHKKKKRG